MPTNTTNIDISAPSFLQRIQRRTYEIVDGAVPDKYSRSLDLFIVVLVITNVIAIILESVPEIHNKYLTAFYFFDLFSVLVFSVEYVVRVWSFGAKYYENGSPMTFGKSLRGRKDYVLSFYGIIDFLSTVPFYLQLLFPGADLRVLRMFRLLRIFKLSRYNSAFEDMVAAVKAERDSFSSAVFLLFISCLLFSSLIYIIEGHDQPEVFPSIPAAMHWFVITIISGWGNVDPVTFLGSILVVLTQFLSIALAAILTGVVASAYTAQVERREALYEMEVRAILADGVVTEEEQARLKQMQVKFGMSDDQVASIAEQVENERKVSQTKQN
jgi:voltage-gated potassium channel